MQKSLTIHDIIYENGTGKLLVEIWRAMCLVLFYWIKQSTAVPSFSRFTVCGLCRLMDGCKDEKTHLAATLLEIMGVVGTARKSGSEKILDLGTRWNSCLANCMLEDIPKLKIPLHLGLSLLRQG